MFNRNNFVIILVIILLLISTIVGCDDNENNVSEVKSHVKEKTEEENSISEQDAKALAREYFIKLYSVRDYSKLSYNKNRKRTSEYQSALKPFLTKEGYNQISSDRYVINIRDIAVTTQTDIKFRNVKFEIASKNGDNIFMNYELNYTLLFNDDTEEIITNKGQMHIKKVEDELKINRDQLLSTSLKLFPGEYKIVNLHEVKEISEERVLSHLKSNSSFYFAVTNTNNKNIIFNPESTKLNLKIYKNDKESYSINYELKSEYHLDKNENLVIKFNKPDKIESGEYKYKFDIQDEKFNDVEPLVGTITIQ